MPTTRYCYHCGLHHPADQMRQIPTRGGVMRYRCIASLKAVRKTQEERDAFGRRVTEDNRREARAREHLNRLRDR